MSITLTIHNSEIFFEGLGGEELLELDLECAYRPVGYQYLPQVKAGHSDGWVRLMKGNKIPLGLLGRVTAYLDEAELPYQIQRVESDEAPTELSASIRGLQPRPYQREAAEAAIRDLRGTIKAPTGAGKTLIAALIIALRGQNALVLVPTLALLHQFHQFLSDHLETDDAIGMIGDGVVDVRPITVATVRSMAQALGVRYEKYEFAEYDDKDPTVVRYSDVSHYLPTVGQLIIDEAHVLGAATTFSVASRIPAPSKIGLSASPWRDDGADIMIEAATGPRLYEITAKELVDLKFLVPPIIQEIDTSQWYEAAAWGQCCAKCGFPRPRNKYLRGGKIAKCTNCGSTKFRSEYQDAYKHEIVENDKRNFQISLLPEKLGGPTLILVRQIAHGKILQKMTSGSLFLSGSDSSEARIEAFDRVKDGDLKTLIGTSIADQGIDIPVLQNLILAGGGKSSTRHLQRIGRVVRPAPGKTFARVIRLNDGHVHRWFKEHNEKCLAIERAEWDGSAVWI